MRKYGSALPKLGEAMSIKPAELNRAINNAQHLNGFPPSSASSTAIAGASLNAPQTFKSNKSEFEVAEYDPEIGNASGLIPYGPNLLVRMDVCVSITSGGIELPDDMIERTTMGSVTGCVYAIGPEAFRGMADRPHVGQRVYIEKYSGIETRGRDGVLYRVMDEKCVACGIADDLCVAEI